MISSDVDLEVHDPQSSVMHLVVSRSSSECLAALRSKAFHDAVDVQAPNWFGLHSISLLVQVLDAISLNGMIDASHVLAVAVPTALMKMMRLSDA